MDRRNFLRGIMAAAAAVAAGVKSPTVAAVAPSPPAGSNVDEAIRVVYGLLRECRITQVHRNGENSLRITYVRDGKRRHKGPLFDWIEQHARPRSISISETVDCIDVRHLGDPQPFASANATVEVDVDWVVSDIENCPVLGYSEVSA